MFKIIVIALLIVIAIAIIVQLIGDKINKELYKAYTDIKKASQIAINELTQNNPKIRSLLILALSPHIEERVRIELIKEVVDYINCVENAKKGIKWDT